MKDENAFLIGPPIDREVRPSSLPGMLLRNSANILILILILIVIIVSILSLILGLLPAN